MSNTGCDYCRALEQEVARLKAELEALQNRVRLPVLGTVGDGGQITWHEEKP